MSDDIRHLMEQMKASACVPNVVYLDGDVIEANAPLVEAHKRGEVCDDDFLHQLAEWRRNEIRTRHSSGQMTPDERAWYEQTRGLWES